MNLDSVKPIELLENLRFPSQMVPFKVKHNFYQSGLGLISYKKIGDVYVVSTEPIVMEDSLAHKNQLWEDFVDFVQQKGGLVCGYYFSKEFEQKGFQKVKLGESRLLSLLDFDLKGKEFREQRRALNYGIRKNYEFREIKKEAFEVQALYKKWRKQKSGPTVKFLLSKPSSNKIELGERQFGVFCQGRLISYTSFLPYREGLYLDSMIHDHDFRFSMDVALVKSIKKFKAEKQENISLGLSAFQNIRVQNFSSLGLWTIGKASFIYNSKGVSRFKKKYPGRDHSRYLVFQQNKSYFKQIYALFRATYPL